MRVPRDFDLPIQVKTRGRITTAGPLRETQLAAGRSIEVEQVPRGSRAYLHTKGLWSSVKVGRTSGDLWVGTTGGPVQIEADAPEELNITPWGGDVDVHGSWDDQHLKIWGPCGRKTLRNRT